MLIYQNTRGKLLFQAVAWMRARPHWRLHYARRRKIGLDPRFISPIGFLDGYLTITNYMVTPVVALVREGFSLHAQPGEVDDIFEVPLSFLMDVKNRQTQSREWKGMTRYFYVYPHGERNISSMTFG
jgi:hypothetical protein